MLNSSCKNPLRRLRLLALAVPSALSAVAGAQDVAVDKALEPVVVTATRSPLDPNLPSTTESRTAAQLREQNFVNVEDALRYVPSTTIRKRYVGDRNSLIGGRSSSELQAPRGLVYADGYLLSQFLGQFNAPRWNVVAPEELARVDVFYGPFSALYPGNSIGTTVVMTTRQPKQFEASARIQYFTQDFDDAGFSGTYGGHQESAWLGNRSGDWTYTLSANRLKNRSQPMQYLTLQETKPGSGTPVTGAIAATNPKGEPWYLAGPSGSAIEDNTQEQVKLKLGYDFSPTLYGEALYTYWRNTGRRSGASLLRDARGNPVYSGLVSINGTNYQIPVNAFSPQNVEEGHGMLGVTLKTKNRVGWNTSAVATMYDITTDLTRTASVPPPQASAGGPGSLADNSGTGWKTLDLQATYTPSRDEAHALTFGFHSNHYRLESRSFNLTNWLHGEPAHAASPNTGFFGKTSVQALYAQDAWKLSPQWTTTLGARYEQWKAYGGSRIGASEPYPERKISAWSPKASVSYMPDSEWLLKASVGKGVRFPTVSELFQGSVVASRIVNNDPNLKPEYSLAKELTVERSIAMDASTGTIRASIFEDDMRDTIFNQTNTLVFGNPSNIQNIDRVRTRGLELSASVNDAFVRGLDLSGNVTFARSVILENGNNPATVGNRWVRVPRVRANLVVSYRPDANWLTSIAMRHAGRQYNQLDNSDINPDTYGGTSSYTVWDAKARYRITRQIEASIGVNNLLNRKYYAFHPYPGRSLIGELHASF